MLTLPVLGHNVAMVEYEYLVLSFGREVGRGDIRRQLTEHAEYGRWELARTRLFAGGARKVWLRRKIIRVRSTLDETLLDVGLQ